MDDVKIVSEQTIQSLWLQPKAQVLESHQHCPKVIETPQNTIIKFFYPKRWPSSNNFYPYAYRFTKNARELHKKGFLAPHIIQTGFCPALKIHYVEYQKIAGVDFVTLAKQQNTSLLRDVIRFMALLHEKGIFFRAVHLSNLIYHPVDNIGLIDICDLKIKPKALSLLDRHRNLKHLFTNKTDKPYWLALGVETAMNNYCHYSKMSNLATLILKKTLKKTLRKSMRIEAWSFT